VAANPTPILRYLAATPLPRLFAYYVGLLAASQLFFLLAARDLSTTLAWLGWLCFAVAFSVIFTVVALYRDDDLLAAAVLLAVMTAVGALASRALVTILLTRSLGPALLLVGVAQIGIFVRVAVSIPVLAGMVWLARRLRRFLAPETVGDPRIHAA
jgi:hypothetical protein